MRWIVIVGMSVALGLTVHAASADTIYTWTDEYGVKHFSNAQPPEDARNVEATEGFQFEGDDGDQRRQDYNRMVRESAAEADRHFEEQEREKARRAEAARQQERDAEAQRIAQQRAELLKQIEEIRSRGYGPTFTKGMQDNQIQQIQERLDQLEAGAAKP